MVGTEDRAVRHRLRWVNPGVTPCSVLSSSSFSGLPQPQQGCSRLERLWRPNPANPPHGSSLSSYSYGTVLKCQPCLHSCVSSCVSAPALTGSSTPTGLCRPSELCLLMASVSALPWFCAAVCLRETPFHSNLCLASSSAS